MKSLKVFTDGASSGNPGPAGIGIVIMDEKNKFTISQSIGRTTNNVAEYTALLIGLQKAIEMGADAIAMYSDSELLVNQLLGRYKVRDEKLAELYKKVIYQLQRFKSYTINHIPRHQNKEADRLARQAIKEFRT